MKLYTLPLSDLNATLENVGGKGMSLAKLSRAGITRPRWIPYNDGSISSIRCSE